VLWRGRGTKTAPAAPAETPKKSGKRARAS
jgi:hypothetical protein